MELFLKNIRGEALRGGLARNAMRRFLAKYNIKYTLCQVLPARMLKLLCFYLFGMVSKRLEGLRRGYSAHNCKLCHQSLIIPRKFDINQDFGCICRGICCLEIGFLRDFPLESNCRLMEFWGFSWAICNMVLVFWLYCYIYRSIVLVWYWSYLLSYWLCLFVYLILVRGCCWLLFVIHLFYL